MYAYTVSLWIFEGLRTESQIAYKIISVDNHTLLDDQTSEAVLAKLMQEGASKLNADNFIEDMTIVIRSQNQCKDVLEEAFGLALEDFYKENDSRCDVQEKSARAFAERKQKELTARLENFRQMGKTRIIPATQGQLDKVTRELEVKLIRIEKKRDGVSFEQKQLASGVIFVESS